MKHAYFFIVLSLASSVLVAQTKLKTENVILITLDGMRWQEVFNGAEARLITRDFVSDSAAVVRDFWAETPQLRRKKMMPFLWTTIATQGQIYGNRSYKNFVNVSNNQWFSYPGYNEIVCGFSDNERIHSNDKMDNQNKNVLEFINGQTAFKGKVAAYSSWDVFPYIINTKRNGIPVNSGIVEAKGNLTEREKWLNEIMHEVPNPLGDVRLDAFTFHYAFEYMKKNNPRVMYIAFDETDDFAHGGKYDLYLHAARYIDGFIAKLWDWCQSNEKYKGKTTIIITVDHGRGAEQKEDWKHHGSKMANSDQIWMAFIGPDTPARGEVMDEGQLYQNQVAKTLAALLGFDYQNQPMPGGVVPSVIGKK